MDDLHGVQDGGMTEEEMQQLLDVSSCTLLYLAWRGMCIQCQSVLGARGD
jgi:hypothetical protein